AADDDVANRGEFPWRGALFGADRGRPAIPRPRRSERDQLGLNALLVTEPNGAADGPATVVTGAGAVCGFARRIVRAAELRLRRDQQPGAAAGEEGTPPCCLRFATYGCNMPRAALQCPLWTVSTSRSSRANSSVW